jgi:ABC-2 type transport system permease protein
MNLKASTFLKPLQYVVEKTGANFFQVCHLVDLRLLLDNRKLNPNSSGKNKDPKNTLVQQSLMFVLVGTFLPLMFSKSNDLFLISFSTHIYLMVMVAVTMMAEYSVSLFDTRDNNLIIPLPVNGQTLGWARVLHILIYLLILSFSLVLPSLVIIGIKFGIASALLMFVASLLNTVFTLFFTIFIYLGLMKLTSGDKLKDVMMYIQVGLAIFIMVGYQLAPRYLMTNNGAEVFMNPSWYFLLIPPAWFSMLTVSWQIHSTMMLAGAVIAVVVPLLAMVFIGKKLFYGFENTLVKLSAGDTSNAKVKSEKLRRENTLWFRLNSILLGVTKSELPIFRLMWKLVGRERLFKQSILPMLAYMIVIPLFSIFSKNGAGDIGQRYMTFIYFTVMTSSMIPSVMCIGSNAYTLWIYQTLPNLKPSSVLCNAMKAAFARFFIPVFILMVAPLFYFKGIVALADIATVFLFNYFVAIAILYFQPPYFPFSQSRATSQGGKTALRMMLIIILALPLGFLHVYLSGKNGWLPLVLSAIFLPILILIDKKWFPRKISWKLAEKVNKL